MTFIITVVRGQSITSVNLMLRPASCTVYCFILKIARCVENSYSADGEMKALCLLCPS